MKSLTLHNMEDVVYRRLKETSVKSKTSLNQAAKTLLRSALGLGEKGQVDRRQDYQEFFGIWSEKDAKVFNAAVADTTRVDPGDWR